MQLARLRHVSARHHGRGRARVCTPVLRLRSRHSHDRARTHRASPDEMGVWHVARPRRSAAIENSLVTERDRGAFAVSTMIRDCPERSGSFPLVGCPRGWGIVDGAACADAIDGSRCRVRRLEPAGLGGIPFAGVCCRCCVATRVHVSGITITARCCSVGAGLLAPLRQSRVGVAVDGFLHALLPNTSLHPAGRQPVCDRRRYLPARNLHGSPASIPASSRSIGIGQHHGTTAPRCC